MPSDLRPIVLLVGRDEDLLPRVGSRRASRIGGGPRNFRDPCSSEAVSCFQFMLCLPMSFLLLSSMLMDVDLAVVIAVPSGYLLGDTDDVPPSPEVLGLLCVDVEPRP